MDKLQMAHEMAIAMIKSNDGYTVGGAVACAWKYADAMQAEADNRQEQKNIEDAIKDKDFMDSLADPMKNVMEQEWQPDWSVAPDGFNWWVSSTGDDGVCKGGFFSNVKPGATPMVCSLASCWSVMNGDLVDTIDFGYVGSWQDSLRKRP